MRFIYNMHDMHLEGLDLTQIRLVAELLRTRSVSAAAQSIGLSQSAADARAGQAAQAAERSFVYPNRKRISANALWRACGGRGS